MRTIYFTVLITLFSYSLLAFAENPALHIYTANVENRFEVGTTATIFVELMTNIEMPNGESEIQMDGAIVGFPPIPLLVTRINKSLFSFVSPVLKITDVGERYFQVQIKTRSKKTADRIKNAIQANTIRIDQNTIAMNSSSDEQVRADYQREISRLTAMNLSLSKQLNSLYVPIGIPRDLGIRVIPRMDENVSVFISQESLSIEDGSMGEYTIKLMNRPTSDVTIRLEANTTAVDLNETLDNQLDLVFTPENFNRPQTIHVGIPCDTTVTQFGISHEAFSRDERFNGLVIENISINVVQE